jgi:HAMP domain-containing protein
MSVTVYLTSLLIFFGTILLVFAMRSASAFWQARSRLASQDAYRDLAEKTAASQSNIAAALAAIETTLADIRNRLTAVEKVLREV